MKIKKFKEITITNTDFFVVEILKNYIVIDNPEGYRILNKNFKPVRTVNIQWLGDDSYFWYSYKDFSGKAILFHAVEPAKLLLMQIPDGTCHLFEFDESLANISFSRIYYWQDDIIILISEDQQFFKIDISLKTCSKVAELSIKKEFKEFYDFWIISQDYLIDKQMGPHSFIFYKENKKPTDIGIYDFDQNKEKLFPTSLTDSFNYEIDEDTLLEVSEPALLITNGPAKEKIIPPSDQYYITNVRFLNRSAMLIQFLDKSDQHHSILTIYEITYGSSI